MYCDYLLCLHIIYQLHPGMTKSKNQISRRQLFSALGLMLVPLAAKPKAVTKDPEEYQILLKPDGTTVKVASSTLKKSKVVRKKLSNKGFYQWLKKK